MVPERLVDAISEVLNIQKFSTLRVDNWQLAREVFLITRLKHMKQTMEFCVKQTFIAGKAVSYIAMNASVEAY